MQNIVVPYIFTGKDELNLSLALDKRHRLFGIKKLFLEGGSIINGAIERKNAIDELSLVVAPIIAGTEGKPLFYESEI